MTWTYDPTLLSSASSSTVSMMKVRLLVGDTSSAFQKLQNEEVLFVLGVQSVINFAAADCADLISAKYADQVNTENSKLAVFAAARHKHYADLAKRLRAAGPGETPGGDGAGIILGGTYAGGTSVNNNDLLVSNTDNVIPPVGVGQDDYFGTESPYYTNPLLGDEDE